MGEKFKNLPASVKEQYCMRCPVCTTRYRKGLKRCPDCQKELVLVKDYEYVEDEVREY